MSSRISASAPPEYRPCHENIALVRTELKATTEERDMLRNEVDRLRGRLDQQRQPSPHETQASRSYDWLKAQCDAVMEELQTLQQEHGDTVDNYVREKERSDRLSSTVSTLHSQLEESNREKVNLREEIVLLQRHLNDWEQRKVPAESPYFESVVDCPEVEKFRTVSEMPEKSPPINTIDFTSLVKLKSENTHLKEELRQTRQERLNAERNLTTSMQAKATLQEDLQLASIAKSRIDVQLQAALAGRRKDAEHMTKLRAERQAIFDEYNLIMSERDSVLREMEQLRSTANTLELKAEAAEKTKKAAVEELEKNRLEFEASRKEARSLAVAETRALDSSYLKEIERLRRDMDKLQGELLDAVHELEDSKLHREWALGERERIVSEQESLRILCDQFRHERDTALNDRIAAMREKDDIRQQKTELSRELNKLREEYEGLVEKERRPINLNSVQPHDSCDSAIDTEIHESEMETVDIYLENVHLADLGFELVTDFNPSGNNPVLVKNISSTSVAYGKLRSCDQILRVNDFDVTHDDRLTILELIRTATVPIHLVVLRRKFLGSAVMVPVQIRLAREHHYELGVELEQGTYVSRLQSGSAEDGLFVGDIIQRVNHIPVQNKSSTEVRQMIDSNKDHLVLDVLRCRMSPTVQTPSTPLSAGEFGSFSPGVPQTASAKIRESKSADGLHESGSTLSKSDILKDGIIDSFHPDTKSVQDECHSERTAEGKRNFLDKALNVIARPFQRSRLNRTARDMRSKSACTYPDITFPPVEELSPKIVDTVAESKPEPDLLHEPQALRTSNWLPKKKKVPTATLR